MAITGTLLIKNGLIIDPSQDYCSKGDIFISHGIIADIPQRGGIDTVVDAKGCLVTPGLIDFHTHLFYGGTEIGIHPDPTLLPQGVTTAVDQGSAGIANWNSFMHSIISGSEIRIFAFLNVAPTGLTTTRYPEEIDPKFFDSDRIRFCLSKYKELLLGLKIRQSLEISKDLGLKPLVATMQIADSMKCPVVVHTTNHAGSEEELVSLLRPGDIYTHVYHGKGENILSPSGKINSKVLDARSKGVLFDTADGRAHSCYSVIKEALKEQFEPDIISTDLTQGNMFDTAVFGLPLIMSKYLNLGMSLQNVVKACTETPSKVIGKEKEIGTLAKGTLGDISIFKLKNSSLMLKDHNEEKLLCKRLFIPQMTVLGGRIVYRNMEF